MCIRDSHHHPPPPPPSTTAQTPRLANHPGPPPSPWRPPRTWATDGLRAPHGTWRDPPRQNGLRD
eukprot:648153-Alexandrium_andersonii.AAC.1